MGEASAAGEHADGHISERPKRTSGKMIDSISKSGAEEVDTSCRICRGEGSDEEPLFYPCKCSGSIKFVHQTCLMEWLSHSQKKYCELCKTHFRFTKLYSSQMPQTLPVPIFLRQLVVHIVKNMLAYARMVLVVFVWLGWLPWSIRHVWGALFYLADGRWALLQTLKRETASADFPGQSLSHKGMSSQPIFIQRNVTSHSPRLETSGFFSQQIQEVFLARIFSLVFPRLYLYTTSDKGHQTADQQSNISAIVSPPLNGSLLSEVKCLQNVFSNPRLNRILVHTLEGQLICLLIVATFILVFLIREWVINQQPANERANNNDADERRQAQAPATPVERENNERGRERGQGQAVRAAERPRRMIAIPRRRREQMVVTNANPEMQSEHENRSSQQPRTSSIGNSSGENAQDNEQLTHQPVSYDIPSNIFQSAQELQPEEFSGQEDQRGQLSRVRPGLQARNADQAPSIQRSLEENRSVSTGQEWPGLETFKSLWERGNCDPAQVLRIIDEEGRRGDLGWIVTHMESLQRSSSHQAGEGNRDTSHDQGLDPKPAHKTSMDDRSFDPLTLLPQNTSSRTKLPNPTQSAPFAPKCPTVPPSESLPLEGLSAENDVSNSTYSDTDSNDWERSPKVFEKDSMKSREASMKSAEIELSENIDALGSQGAEKTAVHVQSSLRELGTAEVGNVTESNTAPENIDQTVADGSAPEQNPPMNETFLDRVATKLWGNANEDFAPNEQEVVTPDDEHNVQDVTEEPPFVPVSVTQHGESSDDNDEVGSRDEEGSHYIDETPVSEAEQDFGTGGRVGNEHDPEVVAAAAEAGIDPNNADAIEDAEDMDGILELIGLRGPLTGLLQNALLSDFLLTFTIAACIWLPYIWGKIAAVFVANPVTCFITIPLQFSSKTADTVIDLTLYLCGTVLAAIEGTLQILGRVTHQAFPVVKCKFVPTFGGRRVSEVLAAGTGSRIESAFSNVVFSLTPDFPTFSAGSHAALIFLKTRIATLTNFVLRVALLLLYEYPCHFHYRMYNDSEESERYLTENLAFVYESVKMQVRDFSGLARAFFMDLKSLRIRLHVSEGNTAIDYSLVYWNTQDRVLAILLGYAFFAFIGYLYLRIGRYLYGLPKGEKLQGPVADTLRQAGGVLKVVLIIGIEMIMFPLYCGLLLDAALLPIFEDVSLKSRMSFIMESPMTGLFVHWFIGTCYMFHFALFVSMCRKILRKGCLYFIRDPDDPTFHPVRDVLERPISTQLNKIAQSALVYGCLVIICLGAVVWVVSQLGEHFPIHWASGQPMLEIPLDLLYFNFALPFLVRRVELSTYVISVYSWWFHECAKMLRLSDFLFGKRHPDEEGRHIRKGWIDFFRSKKGDIENPVIGEDRQILAEDRELDVYFLRDGRFVRAPASDSVRMRRGETAFLEVTECNERTDGQPDADNGPHGRKNKNYTKVYLPPHFRLRIFAFVLSVWFFAAFTGSTVFLLPLSVGRRVIGAVNSGAAPINDLYALSLGVNLSAGCLSGIMYAPSLLKALATRVPRHKPSFADFVSGLNSLSIYLLGLSYLMVAFAIILPLLFSITVELYLFLPLQFYINSVSRPHNVYWVRSYPTIYLVQTWVLGLLYVRCTYRLATTYPSENSRVATAIKSITRDGVLRPDVALATRAALVPAICLCGLLLFFPALLGWVLNHPTIGLFGSQSPEIQSKILSYAYPGLLGLAMAGWCAVLVKRAVGRWRMRIRDEVYLIGERLHNFGERSGAKNRKEGPARANSVTTRVDVGL